MRLSILCVTKALPHAVPFLRSMALLGQSLIAEVVFAADGEKALRVVSDLPTVPQVLLVHSRGFIESVLDEAVKACSGDYIFRLDDDETASRALVEWLTSEEYTESDHWKFPRMHLWPDANSMIVSQHLFPDYQTRLSIKAKSGGRSTVHAGSPFGGGSIAPVAILHHKFLVRSYEERKKTAEIYDREYPGYGTGGMLPFNLPEDFYDKVDIVSVDDGHVPWQPSWYKSNVTMGRAS